MNLELQNNLKALGNIYFLSVSTLVLMLFLSGMVPALALPQTSRKPELIRDTEIAEGTDAPKTEKAKEPNPKLSQQSINIGNFYYKRKNYPAAIQRYLEALEYQQDSVPAYEALVRVYEKTGDTAKAISTCKEFLQKYPASSKSSEFRNKCANLEKSLTKTDSSNAH
jgi:tetratricopeptide (TPR) repeat protein